MSSRVIWINGPFGAGKSTTAQLLADGLPNAYVFDTEQVGYMLRHVLEAPRPVHDFKEWPSWRRVVVETVVSLVEDLGGDLVIPQSVFDEAMWMELSEGISSTGLALRAFTLEVEPTELERRIRNDVVEASAVDWRLGEIARYESARGWLGRRTEMLDTTAIEPQAVADLIAGSFG